MKTSQIFNVRQLLSENIAIEFDTYCLACAEYYGTGDGVEIDNAEFDELQSVLLGYNIPELTNIIKSGIWSGDDLSVISNHNEMISLEKIHHEGNLGETIVQIRRFFMQSGLTNIQQLYIAPKLDGSAAKISWEFTPNIERISLIKSRGGVDITNKFKDKLDFNRTKEHKCTDIAGELLMTKSTFESKYAHKYANPRNFVGKLIKQSVIDKEIIDDLSFVPYSDGKNPILGTGLWQPLNNINDIEVLFNHFKSDSFPYLCDGIVIAYIESGPRRIKDNYPLNMVAVKFPGSTVETTILDYYFTQKKGNRLTPMAVLAPVKLEGINISLASAYNIEYVIENKLGIGARVLVTRSGDITPNIIGTITPSTDFKYPDVDYTRVGKHLIATDDTTSNEFRFVSAIKLLAIGDIGTVAANEIGNALDWNILSIFDQKRKLDIIAALGGVNKKWNNFSSVVYNMKQIPLDLLIQLLQFQGVGTVLSMKVALLITKQSTDSSNISDSVLENVCSGAGIQTITAAINTLKSYGVIVTKPVEVSADTITFEMTQDPEDGMTKAVFVREFNKIYPNAVHTPLTKNTTYLFCADPNNNTGKVNKARKYGIPIIKYSDALNKPLTKK